MSKRAVVIIPTYNERENIGHTIETLLGIFDGITDWKMSILIVDDTSPDKTYEVVREYEKKDDRVKLFLNAKKAGLGGAYIKGMTHAFGELGSVTRSDQAARFFTRTGCWRRHGFGHPL